MNQQFNLIEYVQQQEELFLPAVTEESVSWKKESQFAIQALQKSDHLAKIAINNTTSLQNAIINVAAIGITLNPAAKHAYLVPRDGAVHLDISYMGLLHLAMQTGSILWGQCKLVHEADEYENQGLDTAPTHKYKAFCNRGPVVGGYCTVKTPSGDYLTEEMDLDAIQKVQNTSKSKGSSYSPWNTFWEEMARKTIVKRASKYWPNVERLDSAIHHLNQYEGVEKEPEMAYYSPEQMNELKQEATQELESQINDEIGKMEMAQSENELKLSFQTAYKLTRDNKPIQQEVQRVYQLNKDRINDSIVQNS